MEIVEEIINTRLPDLEDIAEKYYEEKLLIRHFQFLYIVLFLCQLLYHVVLFLLL